MNEHPADESLAGSLALRADVQPSTSSLGAIRTFLCHLCRAAFTTTDNLTRHIRTVHGGQSFPCTDCEERFSRKDNLVRHRKTHKVQMSKTFNCLKCAKTFISQHRLDQHLATRKVLTCEECGKTFMMKAALTSHRKSHNTISLARSDDPQPSTSSATIPPKGCRTALNGSYERHRTEGTEVDIDLPAFLWAQNHADLLRDAIRRKKSVKFFVTANVQMVRPRGWIQRGAPRSYPYFTSLCMRVLEASNINELLEAAYEKIVDSMTKYLREGSGWVVGHIQFVDLVISTYRPLKGSSYIRLPRKLYFTRSIINVKNEDNKCFLWAVLSALHPAASQANRLYHYRRYETSLQMGDLTFPMTSDSIPKFEKLNGLGVNLFGFGNQEVFPIYISESTGPRINLLLISEGVKQHYCWIRDFNRLMHYETKHKAHHCIYCHHQFSNLRILDQHTDKCHHHGSLRREISWL